MDRESTKKNFQKRQNKILRKIRYFDFRLLGNPHKKKSSLTSSFNIEQRVCVESKIGGSWVSL